MLLVWNLADQQTLERYLEAAGARGYAPCGCHWSRRQIKTGSSPPWVSPAMIRFGSHTASSIPLRERLSISTELRGRIIRRIRCQIFRWDSSLSHFSPQNLRQESEDPSVPSSSRGHVWMPSNVFINQPLIGSVISDSSSLLFCNSPCWSFVRTEPWWGSWLSLNSPCLCRRVIPEIRLSECQIAVLLVRKWRYILEIERKSGRLWARPKGDSLSLAALDLPSPTFAPNVHEGQAQDTGITTESREDKKTIREVSKRMFRQSASWQTTLKLPLDSAGPRRKPQRTPGRCSN